MRINKMIKNKKGISVMVGYILLVVFILGISALVFQWLTSYVPGESLNCPDGASLFVNQTTFTDPTLSVSLINTGTFNLRGYFIHIKEAESEDIAARDISSYLDVETSGGAGLTSNSVFFADEETGDAKNNDFTPGETETHYFDLTGSGISSIYSVQVTPTRFEETDGVITYTSCVNARTEQLVD